MGQLKFYENGHIYEYKNQIIPCVSELLRFISREVYGEIDKYILDHAAERGTAVHSATEALDRNGVVDCPEDIAGYIEAYANFLKSHTVHWEYVEQPFAHPKMLYAGTIDRAGYLDDKYTILDIKTNAAIKKPLVKAQLNAYYKLLSVRGKKANQLICLQLLRNGKYRLYPAAIDDTEFMACYRIHAAMTKKQKRGKIT